MSTGQNSTANAAPRLSPEEESKDAFFTQLAAISQAMISEHGKDFAAGALVLAARWVADGRMGAGKPN